MLAFLQSFSLFGTVFNAVLVIIGACIGLMLKKGLSDTMADTVMKGLGLCTLFLGISGSLVGENSMILIISMVVGTLIGQGIDLEDKIQKLGELVERKFGSKKEGQKTSIAEGFVTSSLLFCVGAMSIVGALQSGLSLDHAVQMNKSMLDFVAAIIFASSLGVGVLFSAAFVFVYQGSITLLAEWVAPLLTETVIHEMSCVGSVIIIGLALNMLGITKLKVMNYVPAIFIPIILCMFM